MADIRIRVLTPELAATTYATKASVAAVTKTALGLGNVDNTADVNKPLSSAATTALAGKADVSAVYTKAQVDDKVGSGVGVSPIRLWDKTARTWPAVGSGSTPVVFMSTNDKTAEVPTGMRVELDVWIPHVDATNA